MTFWQWLNSNWVKTLSSAGALNSALIAATAGGMFTGLVEDTTIKWLAILGFFMNAFLVSVGQRNTTQEKVADAKAQVAKAMETAIASTPGKHDGRALPVVLAFIALVSSALLIVGCAGTRAAYDVAKGDPSDLAYVVTEHYSAVLKEAADIAQQPATPESVKDALKRADLAAKRFVVGDPATDLPSLRALAARWKSVKDAETEADLQEQINAAIRELTNFSKAVKAARGNR